MASVHSQVRAKEQAKAEARVKRRAGGGGVHSDVKQDKRLIASMMAKHDKAMGRRTGGGVTGNAPANRLDRVGRGSPAAADVYKNRPGPERSTVIHPTEHDVPKQRARGGRTGRTIVNVHTGGGADQAKLMQAKQEGAKMGAMAVISKLKGAGGGAPPGAPPMGPPPGAMPPPGGAPPPGMGAPPPMPMRKRGGKVKHRDVGGAMPMADPTGMMPGGRPGMMLKKGGPVPAKAVKAVTKPPGAAEAERNKGETGHQEYVKVSSHKRRKAGGAV